MLPLWVRVDLGAINVYNLFHAIKDSLSGKHYASDKEVKTAVMKWLKKQSTEFYEADIHALI